MSRSASWARHRARDEAFDRGRAADARLGALFGLADDSESSMQNLDDELLIEPEGESTEPEIEPGAPPVLTAAEPLVSHGLVEILPADFPLPSLVKFVPNQALRSAVDHAATTALAVVVEGAEGLQRADAALTTLRGSLKAIEEHFEAPTKTAHDLHKRLTGIRSDWQASGKTALATLSSRMVTEQQRLDRLAAEERRRAQEEADRQAREAARREAEAAAVRQAPTHVVEELKQQAESAVGPPVSRPAPAASVLPGSTATKTYKARLAGAAGDEEPNPRMAELTPQQREQVFLCLRAILDGKAPLACLEIDWSYLNNRAKADKATFAIPGFEAFEVGGLRAKAKR